MFLLPGILTWLFALATRIVVTHGATTTLWPLPNEVKSKFDRNFTIRSIRVIPQGCHAMGVHLNAVAGNQTNDLSTSTKKATNQRSSPSTPGHASPRTFQFP
jgi:hypothetical protein